MKLLQYSIIVTLLVGANIAGFRWGIAEARENARLELLVNAMDDNTNRLLSQLAANRVEQERLARPTEKADQRTAWSQAKLTNLVDLRGEGQTNLTAAVH